MNLKYIIDNIQKTNTNLANIDVDSICHELKLDITITSSPTNIKSYWISKFLDTDVCIGTQAFFLNDSFVFYTKTTGRNKEPIFFWASTDALSEVTKYLLSKSEKDNTQKSYMFVNFDLEQGDGYQVKYSSELLTDDVIHIPSNQHVTILDKWKNVPDLKQWKLVKIEFPSGDTEIVPLTTILIPFITEN